LFGHYVTGSLNGEPVCSGVNIGFITPQPENIIRRFDHARITFGIFSANGYYSRSHRSRLMYETEAEMEELQGLLDASMDRAGTHLRSIFSDDKRLSARQVSRCLQGVGQVAAATVNSKGEPRVAPIDAAFFHGRFFMSTEALSLRARHLTVNNSISLTYFQSADPVIIVHGRARAFIRKDSEEFRPLDSEWERAYGASTQQLSEDVVFILVEPSRMLAYAFHPERFPGD